MTWFFLFETDYALPHFYTHCMHASCSLITPFILDWQKDIRQIYINMPHGCTYMYVYRIWLRYSIETLQLLLIWNLSTVLKVLPIADHFSWLTGRRQSSLSLSVWAPQVARVTSPKFYRQNVRFLRVACLAGIKEKLTVWFSTILGWAKHRKSTKIVNGFSIFVPIIRWYF
jgi:hypothetical protein